MTYQNIPVTPNTVAEIIIHDLNNIGNLEIDMDGDGQIDISINEPEDTIDPI